VDFIQFDLSDFDIILGINWLHTYGAKIDYDNLKAILKDKKGRKVFFYGQREEKSYLLIYAMKTSKRWCQGCVRYWCYAIDTQAKEEIAENIPIVCEIEDVFPKELPGLLLWGKIDFGIELIPDAQSIS